jgi:hypothetical protein
MAMKRSDWRFGVTRLSFKLILSASIHYEDLITVERNIF